MLSLACQKKEIQAVSKESGRSEPNETLIVAEMSENASVSKISILQIRMELSREVKARPSARTAAKSHCARNAAVHPSICEHCRQRTYCKGCEGSSMICQHCRVKSRCKECGGALICQHGRVQRRCQECGGISIRGTGGRRGRPRTPAGGVAPAGSSVPAGSVPPYKT